MSQAVIEQNTSENILFTRDRPDLWVVPDDVESIKKSDEMSRLETTIIVVEATAAQHSREITDEINTRTLQQIGRLRAQVEFITALMRARGDSPPEDASGYIGHDEVMFKVAEYNLPTALADISRLDSHAIHEAFTVTANRGDMIRYGTDNQYFMAWATLNHPEAIDYLNQLHAANNPNRQPGGSYDYDRHLSSTIDSRPFMKLYEQWIKTPESVKNACIVYITSERLGLENIGPLTPEELLTVRERVTTKARELLHGDVLRETSPALRTLDRQIAVIESKLKTYGVTDVGQYMLETAVANLKPDWPNTDEDIIAHAMAEIGVSAVDPEHEEETAKQYLKLLQEQLDRFNEANVGATALRLVS